MSPIVSLRDMMPLRPLTLAESLRVTELQATRFLAISGITEPPVPDEIVTSLPRVQVQLTNLAGTSGMTEWSHGRWLILLNETESSKRRRFSLFHEAKHIIDHPWVEKLYPDLPELPADMRRERICDYFAACVLMPKTLVVRAYCDQRIQDVTRLARLFDVSVPAMRYRLSQIGLSEPTPRCLGPVLPKGRRYARVA